MTEELKIDLKNQRREVKLLTHPQTGHSWPYYKEKKALSASTLTKVLREMEYGEIPSHILLKAAERGKYFHNIIQDFFKTGSYPFFVDSEETKNLSKLEKKIRQTINFLKKSSLIKPQHYVGKERLHYVFHKDELIATYIDLEFQDYVVELKTNSGKTNRSPFSLLIFEIQLLVQYLCTNKDVYLLWSADEGVVFKQFYASDYSLKILDVLIDLVKKEEIYPLTVRKAILQEIVESYYTPPKLIAEN